MRAAALLIAVATALLRADAIACIRGGQAESFS
jgi:hypothetical protein